MVGIISGSVIPKTLVLLALPGPITSRGRRADHRYGYKWISGPITTVHDERIVPNATAVTRAGSNAQKWFSESSRSGIVILANQPISVRRIGVPT